MPSAELAAAGSQFVDAETGEPVDPEAYAAAHGKPAHEWTREEVWDTFAEEFGWDKREPNPHSVAQVNEVFTRAFPSQGQEIKRTTDFVLAKAREVRLPRIWAPSLDLRQWAIESAGRQHPRERQERRSVGASAGGGDPPEGESDEPPDRVAPRRPLSRRERAFLRREVDRLRRQQLVQERAHLQGVPEAGWPA